ncbi:hypothetical protein TWF225_006479 [Orbilia oligospora]|nr:hypothetical protein TWF225_006479 [Orbilia oligospora]KAF3232974.1 hypothetical protein TWF128_003489 [Orbilia oligospora]
MQQLNILLSTFLVFLLAIAGVNSYAIDSNHRHEFVKRYVPDRVAPRQAASPSPTPRQPGTVANCLKWRYTQMSGTVADTCDNIVTRFKSIGLTKANLIKWNPALKSDCSGFQLRYYLCVQAGPAPTTTKTTAKTTTKTTTETTSPTPRQPGTVANCLKWRYTQMSGTVADTCDNIVTRFKSIGLTKANLIKWNPALKSDCSGFQLRYYLCVQAGPAPTTTKTTAKTTTKSTTKSTTTSSKTTTKSTTTSSKTTTTSPKTTTTSSSKTTTSSTSTTRALPAATQSGQTERCINWRYVKPEDTCENIVERYKNTVDKLTLPNLLQWNPALKDDCSGLTIGYWVCVRVEPYWIDSIKHQGKTPYAESGYQVYRNVKDFGAKGDGVTDDTAAIQNAIASGNRCGLGCDSSTTKPALVFFPPGTYIVSRAIITYYQTHMIGDPFDLPRLKAAPSFEGYAVIEGNPYYAPDKNWHGPTNNFYKVVRNFIIDTTAMPPDAYGTGIHWQVAQATSLTNIIFYSNPAPGTRHQGLYIENGSGGYMSNLVFNGGKFGAWIGNQQFTLRNFTFNNCDTGIFLVWGWVWHLKSMTFNNNRVGIDMTAKNSTGVLQVGSVVLSDSNFNNVEIAIASDKSVGETPKSINTLAIDNISINNCPVIVGVTGSTPKLAGTSGTMTVTSWVQGRKYTQSAQNGQDLVGPNTGFSRPAGLLDSNGKILERSKPNYETYTISQILSVRDLGVKGDGTTDDTAALQAAINKAAAESKVLYIDYGVYVVTNTITVPPNSRIMGETWPVILASGSAFSNMASPRVVVQFGRAGESGFIEGTNFIVATRGPMAGAILMQWNLASTGEVSGLYDVHARVGGFAGSNLDANTCLKTPGSTTIKTSCVGAYMLMHISKTASRVVFENTWWWTADHDLDLPAHDQITVFVGRGVLIESTQPIWLYGTASEHNVLYQYQLTNAANVYMGMIQTETPYYQSNPVAPAPFTVNSAWNDPDYNSICSSLGGASTCKKSYGLRTQNSNNILIYGAGLYSFFENYTQTCLSDESCQKYMISFENTSNIRLYALTTKGSESLLTVNNAWSVPWTPNANIFGATIGLYQNPA